MVLVRFDQHDTLLDDLSIHFHQCRLAARIRRIGVSLEAGRRLDAWLPAPAWKAESDRAGPYFSARIARVGFAVRPHTLGGGRHLQLDLLASSDNPGPVRLLHHRIELEVALPDGPDLKPDEVRWFRNGWQSWSFAGTLQPGVTPMPQPRVEWIRAIKEDPLVPARSAPFVSDMVASLRLRDEALAVGAANQRYFQRIRLDSNVRPMLLTLEIDLDRQPMHPGQTLALGSWQLEGEHTASYLVREWASRQAATAQPAGQAASPAHADSAAHSTPAASAGPTDFAGAPVPRGGLRSSRPLAGWCSWYDRKRRITHSYIGRTVERLRSTPELSGLSTVVIDDGYQSRVGDWLVPRPGYGGSVLDTARLIRDAGLAPGIWVAPFVAQAGSELVERHPEWVATRNGRPYGLGFNPHWRSTFYALDIRNLDLLAHLASVFAELRAAGFWLFKLDYLYPAALPLDRGPDGSGRFEAFRNAVAHLRKAAGNDSYFLGCGCPLAPSAGLFDAIRVSTDIDYCWKTPTLLHAVTGDEEMVGIFPAARNTMVRRLFGPSLWRVDPDCVLLSSGKGTATAAEKLLFARLAALSGDVFLVGDDLTRWGPADLAAFSELFAGLGHELVPLDAADRVDPTWAFVSGPGGPAVAAFNMGDRKEMASVQLAHLRSLLPGVSAVSTAAPVVAKLDRDRIDVSPVESRAAIVVDLRPSGSHSDASVAREVRREDER